METYNPSAGVAALLSQIQAQSDPEPAALGSPERILQDYYRAKADITRRHQQFDIGDHDSKVAEKAARQRGLAEMGRLAAERAERARALLEGRDAHIADEYRKAAWDPSKLDLALVSAHEEQLRARIQTAQTVDVVRSAIEDYSESDDRSRVYAAWRLRGEVARHHIYDVRPLSGRLDSALDRYTVRDPSYLAAVERQNAAAAEALGLVRSLHAMSESELGGRVPGAGPWTVFEGQHTPNSAAMFADHFKIHPTGQGVGYWADPRVGNEPTTVAGIHRVAERPERGGLLG